jgi:hypothetical protein
VQSSSVIHYPDIERGGVCSIVLQSFLSEKLLRSVITRVLRFCRGILGGARRLGVDSRNREGTKSGME